jgi:hypothetical protein
MVNAIYEGTSASFRVIDRNFGLYKSVSGSMWHDRNDNSHRFKRVTAFLRVISVNLFLIEVIDPVQSWGFC